MSPKTMAALPKSPAGGRRSSSGTGLRPVLPFTLDEGSAIDDDEEELAPPHMTREPSGDFPAGASVDEVEYAYGYVFWTAGNATDDESAGCSGPSVVLTGDDIIKDAVVFVYLRFDHHLPIARQSNQRQTAAYKRNVPATRPPTNPAGPTTAARSAGKLLSAGKRSHWRSAHKPRFPQRRATGQQAVLSVLYAYPVCVALFGHTPLIVDSYAIKGSPNQKLLLEDIYYAIESRVRGPCICSPLLIHAVPLFPHRAEWLEGAFALITTRARC